MELNVRLTVSGSHSGQSERWLVSTRTEINEIQPGIPLKLEVAEDGWFDVWSDTDLAWPEISKEGGDVLVKVVAPSERKGGNVTLLHVTDLHFSTNRSSGPVLGLEEFGDITTSIGIGLDVAEACRAKRFGLHTGGYNRERRRHRSWDGYRI